ncbi:hypothetical protein PWG71_03005 [Nocardiopsis sp. N85]|uniref:hypothetical protein n=1 Tax=Nocardiopsis sp. N85 TaxID=3029400 RepID=UPI00237FAE98|nr:hypothetical protein [Nocardiopsis sp. N85]MDE3720342.1 hypothetical protein [Nocardiopsis sp. N85]
MSHPSRPTFDPTLPRRTLTRLRGHPERLLPDSLGPSSRLTWRRGAALTAAGGTSLAALALLVPGSAAPLIALLCLIVTAVLLGLISDRGSLADDWADLLMHGFWALPVSSAIVLTGNLLLGGALEPLAATVPGSASTAALYLLVTAGGAGAVMRPGMLPRLASEHRHRYVLPQDFGRPYSHATRHEEPEAHLFARLQQATDRVQEGTRVLGGSFDAAHTLPLLREEEWRMSQELLRLRTLRREVVQRKREAVSPQVTRALQPQEEAVARAHTALSERIAVLADYGERVHAAVTAHREWEQCQAIADRAAEYADLALTTARDTMYTDEIDDSLLSVRAAHSVREELVREAVDAGSSLSAALHPGDHRPDTASDAPPTGDDRPAGVPRPRRAATPQPSAGAAED